MAAEPPTLRLRPPGSAGDSPPVPRLLGGCVPLSHQVAGHMYGKDKVGECGLGSPSLVFSVHCPGSHRPPLCPAPAVVGLRCPQSRWSSEISCRHSYSHWSPLSPPRQSQASGSLSQLSPALLSLLWAAPGLPFRSQLSTALLLPTRQSPASEVLDPRCPQPRVPGSSSPEPPLSLGLGSRAPPGATTVLVARRGVPLRPREGEC